MIINQVRAVSKTAMGKVGNRRERKGKTATSEWLPTKLEDENENDDEDEAPAWGSGQVSEFVWHLDVERLIVGCSDVHFGPRRTPGRICEPD